MTRTLRAPAPGKVITRHLVGPVIETVYEGHCGAEAVQTVLDITPELLRTYPKTRWLLDLSQITTTNSDARVPGRQILRLFREAGGERFAIVVASSTLRMLLTTVAFAVGLPVKIFDDRRSAYDYVVDGSLEGPRRESAATQDGAIPACPRCKAPMQWREQYARHFCEACSVYR